MAEEKVLKLELIDYEEEFRKDMESGAGFVIDDKGLTKDGKRTMNGIYSPRYGTELSTGSDMSYERYKCDCGQLVGKFYEGAECPICHEKVKMQVDDIFTTGWICFNDYKLINPQMYNFISKFIGPKALNDMTRFNRDIDRDGFIQDCEPIGKNPFVNIGLGEFYERFDEIIEHYKAKMKPEKKKILKFIMDNRDKVFINKFPVFSLMLRPILVVRNEVLYSDINKKYQLLVTCSQSLNATELEIDNKPIKTMPVLFQAQELINEIHKSIIKTLLAEKKGLIRNNHLGCRLNFSSRCVIVPLIEEAKIDEVYMPYLAFLELYKFEIINLICSFDKIALNEANKRWNEASQHFDEKIFLIMEYLVKNTKGGIRCIVNRNPSLNLGSILLMKVTKVKRDIKDMTLSLPVQVLGLLSADFDGDVVNIISIKDKSIIDTLDPIFNPRKMLIDRNNCSFNRRVSLLKDQLIGLYAFCNHE